MAHRSTWPLNLAGAVLIAALAGAVLLSVVLWIALERTRSELEVAEAAQKSAPPAVERAAPVPPPAVEVPVQPVPAAVAASAPVVEERLILLLTVGTRHYAEKQLRELRQKCRAPLAVYLQRKGRCGWSQCFAIAARETDADLARECGPTKGQALRKREDFLLLQ